MQVELAFTFGYHTAIFFCRSFIFMFDFRKIVVVSFTCLGVQLQLGQKARVVCATHCRLLPDFVL